jgi:hypothetical protein
METLGPQLTSLPDSMLSLLHQFLRTTTGNAASEWSRLCAANGIHFDEETGSAISVSGATLDIPTPEFVGALEREAVDFDQIKLGRSSLGVWRDRVDNVRSMEREADMFYRRRLLWAAMGHWREVVRRKEVERQRLERRWRGFREWSDAVMVSVCLRKWVLSHRELSMQNMQRKQAGHVMLGKWREATDGLRRKEQQAEDARDFYAVSEIFGVWRRKAHSKRAERRFKRFFLMAKYGMKMAKGFKVRRKARMEAELTRKYRDFVGRKDEKLKRQAFEGWHAKAVQIKEDDISANEHYEQSLTQRGRTLAHTALTRLYDQTVDNKENAQIADTHYERVLLEKLNILNSNGKWRVQTRASQESQQRADDYRGIKTEEKAQGALRNMRNTAARNKQMLAMAEEWRDKQDKRRALTLMGLWRQKAAGKRGAALQYEVSMPQTPAAKKNALLR